MLHIVLYQPEIPQNTGNIARTCAALGAMLHLVRPLGFLVSEKTIAKGMQRAGLDYLKRTSLVIHDSWSEYLNRHSQARIFALSSVGRQLYTEAVFQDEDHLLFGRESDGLPPDILERFPSLRLPMPGGGRSLNLAVSVGVAAFEAMRQITQNWRI